MAFSTEAVAEVERSPAAPGSGAARLVPAQKSFAVTDPIPGASYEHSCHNSDARHMRANLLS